MNDVSVIAVFATWIWFIVTAVMLARVDFREHRLPNRLVLVALVGGVFGFALTAQLRGDLGLLVNACAGSFIACMIYLAIHLLGGMGMGDVKYAAVVGLYLGSLGWNYLYVGSLISFTGAAVWALPLLFTQRKTRNVPFGPFMAAGVVISGIIAVGVSAGA